MREILKVYRSARERDASTANELSTLRASRRDF
jgi:hypothetical protein